MDMDYSGYVDYFLLYRGDIGDSDLDPVIKICFIDLLDYLSFGVFFFFE